LEGKGLVCGQRNRQAKKKPIGRVRDLERALANRLYIQKKPADISQRAFSYN
jgi:hypothetical protein